MFGLWAAGQRRRESRTHQSGFGFYPVNNTKAIVAEPDLGFQKARIQIQNILNVWGLWAAGQRRRESKTHQSGVGFYPVNNTKTHTKVCPNIQSSGYGFEIDVYLMFLVCGQRRRESRTHQSGFGVYPVNNTKTHSVSPKIVAGMNSD